MISLIAIRRISLIELRLLFFIGITEREKQVPFGIAAGTEELVQDRARMKSVKDTAIEDEDTAIEDEDTAIEDEDTAIEDEGTAIEDEGTAIEDEGTERKVNMEKIKWARTKISPNSLTLARAYHPPSGSVLPKAVD